MTIAEFFGIGGKMANRVQALNDLRIVSNDEFVDIFVATAEQLSTFTGREYISYIEEAIEMRKAGKSLDSVLEYYDNLLRECSQEY
jgi:hypothetical protein